MPKMTTKSMISWQSTNDTAASSLARLLECIRKWHLCGVACRQQCLPSQHPPDSKLSCKPLSSCQMYLIVLNHEVRKSWTQSVGQDMASTAYYTWLELAPSPVSDIASAD